MLGTATEDQLKPFLDKGILRSLPSVVAKPALPIYTFEQVENLFGEKWYKKWWVWAIVATALAGTGLTIYLVRRRRT